jgi:hypothetical protein
MLSRRHDERDLPPAAVVTPPAANIRETMAGDVISRESSWLRYWRRARKAVAAFCSCAGAGSIGYALGGPALAVTAFIAIVVLGAVIAIVLSAMLGSRDPRSPFERVMLIICVFTGSRPRDYLAAPPARINVGLTKSASTASPCLFCEPGSAVSGQGAGGRNGGAIAVASAGAGSGSQVLDVAVQNFVNPKLRVVEQLEQGNVGRPAGTAPRARPDSRTLFLMAPLSGSPGGGS